MVRKPLLASQYQELTCLLPVCPSTDLTELPQLPQLPELPEPPSNLMSDAYPPFGATGVMGVWTLGLGLLGDSE